MNYVQFKYNTGGDPWRIESDADLDVVVPLMPMFERCRGFGCSVTVTASSCVFETEDKLRVVYRPTQGPTIETAVIPTDKAKRLIDYIESIIEDYRDQIGYAIGMFLQNEFIEENS